jgi:hypothetical protein
VDQLRDGASPLARTLVLVAPTPAEYRLLGVNERLLASLRTATGGQALEGDAAATGVWAHDVPASIATQDLGPLLVLLAMLLWPLDVGVRRLNVGRRDLTAGRAWIALRWARRRGSATRTAGSAAMLATRERAGGSSARTSLLSTPASQATPPSAPPERATPAPPPSMPPASAPPAAGPPPGPATPAGPATPPSAPSSAEPADTMARLRGARDRARR